MYNYICVECETETIYSTFLPLGDTLNQPCEVCSHPTLIRTVGNFTTVLSMPEHFNSSTGEYVTNRLAFKDQLNRKSDEMSERLGMTVKYGEVDASDKKSLGVTSEGVDESLSKEANPIKRKTLDKAFS